MKLMLALFLLTCLGSLLSANTLVQEAAPLKGDWSGALDTGAGKLKLILHFTVGEEGKWRGTMDSPDQGANGLRIDTISLDSANLKFAMTMIGASYEGTVKGDEITGKFMQGGATFPLNFKRASVAEMAPPKRPQTPKAPFPYNEEEVVFDNPAANIKLAGTLTTPRTNEPVPAVVLITGSGPQDRNESLLGHQPFWVLSDHLTRAGIAVLRFDDRGVGKSTGKFSTATSADFASDVLAGVEFLKTRKEINVQKIGLLGHSEGGMIGPMVAVKSKDIAFLVLLAGPGVPAEELLYEQAALMMRAEGSNDAAVAANRKIQEQMFAVLKTETDPQVIAQKLQDVVAQVVAAAPEAEKKQIETALKAQIVSVNTPWFRFYMTYDPRTTLRQVKVPVLALNGELDLQVAVKQNLPEIAKALQAGGNRNVQTVVLPKLNHLFQTAQTGAFSEYAKIEETFSPTALNLISKWVVEQTGVKQK